MSPAMRSTTRPTVGIYVGDDLARYGFPGPHRFGPDRLAAFWREAGRRGLCDHDRLRVLEPAVAGRRALERFHLPAHIDHVRKMSAVGHGLLDHGDTPAFPGCYEAAATVVGTVLDATERIMAGEIGAAFVPIAGLHHARRGGAEGFCIFNDCSVAIETLKQKHGLERIGYVDIDAHHGDGVFYGAVEDPAVIITDLHEDGRFLYPGSGDASETGNGAARGTKLNIPLPPGADDLTFRRAWSRVEAFLEKWRPQFYVLQCGGDSIAGDPIAHLAFSPQAHRHATRSLVRLAGAHADGRLLVTGGGGYNHANIAAAWCAALEELLEAPTLAEVEPRPARQHGHDEARDRPRPREADEAAPAGGAGVARGSGR